MKLYRNSKDLTRWFAFGAAEGWLMFPPAVEGWEKRQSAPGIDRLFMCEVPIYMGFNTGIPGAPMLAGGGSDRPLRAAAYVSRSGDLVGGVFR
jgi:hypothetical protein